MQAGVLLYEGTALLSSSGANALCWISLSGYTGDEAFANGDFLMLGKYYNNLWQGGASLISPNSLSSLVGDV